MPDGTRVPKIISEFNNYIITTNNRLLTTNIATGHPYWMDFNFTTSDQTQWASYSSSWLPLYATYQDPTTSTSAVKHEVKTFMDTFTAFAQPLLNRIVASGMAADLDAEIFHIVLHRADPTHHTTPIPEACIAALTAKNMGEFDIRCKSALDESRPSIPTGSGANSVQYAYVTGAAGLVPFNPDASTTVKGVSTKSHFQLNLGSTLQGQWLYIIFRWYNTHNPAIAGAWSAMQSMVIG